MTPRPRLLLALALAAAPAGAQERPPEEDVFGAPPAPAKQEPPEEPRRPSDADVFGKPPPPPGEAAEHPAAEARLRSRLGETDNPLQIGGVLYLRGGATAQEATAPSRWPFSSPSLVDVYLDARPSERVRGFGLVRTFYDPTLASPSGLAALQGSGQVSSLGQGATLRSILDQLWLRFDADRTVFFTAGRQHVKWGTGRFWNPTDFLHTNRRNPLATFDDRAGTAMLKAHLPWEARGWNFYAMALAEPLLTKPSSPYLVQQQPPSDQLGAVGGAARAEVVMGSWEIGVDGAAQRGMDPRLGLDFSTGLWEIDLRGEAALRRGSDAPRWRVPPPGNAIDPVALRAPSPSGLRTSAVLGAEWQHRYSDEDTFTVGAEYFWNQNGYGDAHVYPVLAFTGSFTPFYVGRHYAGAWFYLPKPGSWNLHTFTFSVLGNLSDVSFVGRIDWSVTLLTYLTLETWLAGHAGTRGGEFRFGIDRSVQLPAGVSCPAGTTTEASGACRVYFATPIADAGLALRMAL